MEALRAAGPLEIVLNGIRKEQLYCQISSFVSFSMHLHGKY